MKRKTTMTFQAFVGQHGERKSAVLLRISYSMLRRAVHGQIRISGKVLSACEVHLGTKFDREGTVLAWDRAHQDYLASEAYAQTQARNDRNRARRIQARAPTPAVPVKRARKKAA